MVGRKATGQMRQPGCLVQGNPVFFLGRDLLLDLIKKLSKNFFFQNTMHR